MKRTNIEVVRNYIEEIINQKKFERLSEFVSEDCVTHSPPYVGLGITADDSSGEQVILSNIAPNGPAYAHLRPGDELVRIHDNEHAWETFEEIKNGLWGQGILGSEVTVTIRRGDSLITIPLMRSRINDFDIKLADVWENFTADLRQNWPDLRTEIQLIFESGDLVTCYAINSGTNLEYVRSAVWAEIDIFKMKEGRIAEMWSVENTFAELKQLGYQVTTPVREMA